MPTRKTVSNYAFLHYRDGRTRLNIFFTDGTYDYYFDLEPARASFLADLLRNEKPVYWTHPQDILWTGKEPVGEEEGMAG